MSSREMEAGMRLFLYPGGAENLDPEQLIAVRDRCIEVLKIKKVPQGKHIHYVFLNENNRKQTACDQVLEQNIIDDNSTGVVSYVNCKNCKSTKMFKLENGELVDDRAAILHLAIIDNNYTSATACGSMLWTGGKRAKTAHGVTCKNCMKTRTYAKAMGLPSRGLFPKKKKTTLHSTIDHTGVTKDGT